VAVTEESAALVEEWRLSQVQLRASVEAEVLGAMQLLDYDNIADTWPTVERMIVRLIEEERRRSERLSLFYYDQVRNAEGVTGLYEQVGASPFNRNATVRSLRIMGPGEAGRGMALGRANVPATTATKVSGVAARMSLDGGRDSTLRTSSADPKVIGYVRVTDGNPCAFCAMLASRGVSYRPFKSKGAALGKGGKKSVFVRKDKNGRTVNDFRAHDHCACTAKPVYSKDDPLPGRSEEFLDLWNRTGDLNSFRRELTRLQREAAAIRA
jgi:hypothetical protein